MSGTTGRTPYVRPSAPRRNVYKLTAGDMVAVAVIVVVLAVLAFWVTRQYAILTVVPR